MPTYSYCCNTCQYNFELFFYIKDYNDKPECSKCHSLDTYRRYVEDILTQNASVKKSDSELKTIGDLADRNRDKMSEDYKRELHEKHNSYKENKEEKPLPSGMSRMKKGSKTIWPN